MIRAVAFLENWGIHQDYGWFLAVIFWAIAAVGFYSRKHWANAMPWLVAFAASNLAMPVLEIAHFFVGLNSDEQTLVRLLGEDMAIGAVPALSTVFLVMAALAGAPAGLLVRRTHRVILLGLGLIAAEQYALWRNASPVVAGSVLGLVGAIVVAWLARPRGPLYPAAAAYWVTGLVCWGLLFWFATTGPLAYLAGEGRGLYQFSSFGAPAQLVSLAAAISFAVAAWQVRLNAGRSGSAWPETRRALWPLTIWLAFGFVLVEWSSRSSRHDYETNLLRRARLVAAYLDKDALDAALGPAFQLGKVESRARLALGSGAESTLHFTSLRAGYSPPFNLLREQLKPALDANSDFWDLSLSTLRRGWLAVTVKWPDYHNYFSEVVLTRMDSDLDRIKQAGPDGIVLAPRLEPWGYIVHAFVPLSGRNFRTGLGWLDVEIVAVNWAVEFNRARIQAMAVLLVGVLLWATAVRRRQQGIRQSEAEALAMAAVAADQAKSRFLAHVSHELRTPLQGMLGYAELMAGGPLEPEQRQRLAAVLSQGVVLKRLVNDLIDLGAIQSGAFRLVATVFDPVKLARECVEGVAPGAAVRKLDVRLQYNAALADAGMVRADAVRLRQILLNLLGNAVKFTEAGEVTLDLAVEFFEPASRTLQLRVVVRDNGPGIPAALRAQLFKPFSTLGRQSDREGAGLGLAISAAIAREMGGTLVLLDEGPPGAAFQLRLECERAAVSEVEPGPTVPVSWGRLNILVADDNLLVRTWLTEVFTARGARVRAVANGLEALQACAEVEFDVVVLDISMPLLDGWAVARQLRRRPAAHPRPRLVGLSAHASAGDRQRAGEAGFDAFLTKPVDLADLASVLAGFQPEVVLDPEPGSGDGDALRERLDVLYWRDFPASLARLRAALESGDRRGLAEGAHHLKNSADITQRTAVALICQQLENDAPTSTAAELDGLLAELIRVSTSPSSLEQMENPELVT